MHPLGDARIGTGVVPALHDGLGDGGDEDDAFGLGRDAAGELNELRGGLAEAERIDERDVGGRCEEHFAPAFGIDGEAGPGDLVAALQDAGECAADGPDRIKSHRGGCSHHLFCSLSVRIGCRNAAEHAVCCVGVAPFREGVGAERKYPGLGWSGTKDTVNAASWSGFGAGNGLAGGADDAIRPPGIHPALTGLDK